MEHTKTRTTVKIVSVGPIIDKTGTVHPRPERLRQPTISGRTGLDL